MKSIQIRLPKKMLKEIDCTISKGLYTSRSELIRDCIRKHIEYEKFNNNIQD